MELEELKSMWTTIKPLPKTDEQLREMLKENKHPVLKSIRNQFTIEVIGWVAFLLCYYSMFDGSTKPLPANVVLIIGILTPIIHNLYGYNFAKYLTSGSSLKRSLENYLRKMQIYMRLSIFSRIIFVCCLILFFATDINLTPWKLFVLAASTLVLIFIVSILSYKIWKKRIAGIRMTLDGFT